MGSPYDPEPIEVIAPKGTPKAVQFRMRLLQVNEVVNIWRIDDAWWQ